MARIGRHELADLFELVMIVSQIKKKKNKEERKKISRRQSLLMLNYEFIGVKRFRKYLSATKEMR